MNNLNHESIKNLYYRWGVIDGVVQGITTEQEQIRDDDFSIQILEEEKQKWIKIGESIIEKITGRKLKEGN